MMSNVSKFDAPKLECLKQTRAECLRVLAVMSVLQAHIEVGDPVQGWPVCEGPKNAAVKRASLDLTRKLAELRRTL